MEYTIERDSMDTAKIEIKGNEIDYVKNPTWWAIASVKIDGAWEELPTLQYDCEDDWGFYDGDGLSIDEVSEKYGVSENMLEKIIKESKPNRSISIEDKAELLRMELDNINELEKIAAQMHEIVPEWDDDKCLYHAWMWYGKIESVGDFECALQIYDDLEKKQTVKLAALLV